MISNRLNVNETADIELFRSEHRHSVWLWYACTIALAVEVYIRADPRPLRAAIRAFGERLGCPAGSKNGLGYPKRAANDVFAQLGKTPGFWWLHHQLLG